VDCKGNMNESSTQNPPPPKLKGACQIRRREEQWFGRSQLDQTKQSKLPCFINRCARSTFPVYIHESWILGKLYGIKLSCCLNNIEEQLKNLVIPMGTHWEQGKIQKKSPSLLSSLNGKNWTSHDCMLSLLISLFHKCKKFIAETN